MLLGWGVVGLVYHGSDRLQGVGHTLAPGWLDRAIPFSPDAVWLYLSFFLIIPLCYLICPLRQVIWLRSSMQLSALIAGAIYLLWPTTMDYPHNAAHSLSSTLLAVLTRVDSAQNCLPSLHVALTALAIWAAADAQHKWRSALLILWGLAIAFSILQLRRHLFVDLLSGAVLAMMVGWICWRIQWIGGEIRQEE